MSIARHGRYLVANKLAGPALDHGKQLRLARPGSPTLRQATDSRRSHVRQPRVYPLGVHQQRQPLLRGCIGSIKR
jgi:hypothetical protein